MKSKNKDGKGGDEDGKSENKDRKMRIKMGK